MKLIKTLVVIALVVGIVGGAFFFLARDFLKNCVFEESCSTKLVPLCEEDSGRVRYVPESCTCDVDAQDLKEQGWADCPENIY
jgi:hypothetical protein